MFEGPADELTLTKNSQIAIYVMSVALWRVIKQELPEIEPSVVAGLSLGEYSALTASEDSLLKMVSVWSELGVNTCMMQG